jgi:hypothetical protein
MDDALQAQLAELENEVGAAAIPDGSKHTATWCFGQLSSLYAKFRQTSESRYGDKITHLVQGMLKELTTSERACPAARNLAAGISDRLRHLHEQFGLPGLNLTPPGGSPPRSQKAG